MPRAIIPLSVVITLLAMLLPMPAAAVRYDPFLACQKVWREDNRRPTGPHETVVSLRSYMRCWLQFWPRNEGGLPPVPGDAVGRGTGAGREPEDPATLDCPTLRARVSTLRAQYRLYQDALAALNESIVIATEVHDRAESALAAARARQRSTAGRCATARTAANAARLRARQRCAGLIGDRRVTCVEEELEGASVAPAIAREAQMCGADDAARIDLNLATSSESDAAEQVRQLFNRRAGVYRDSVRFKARLDAYADALRTGCPR
jgi:hypothetical protein